MFDRALKFFIENYKINYALFFLLIGLGSYSYTQIPKEVSPTIEADTLTIRGAYSGASADLLNKIAVQEIEDKCQNIDGIDGISSIISSGKFSITLEIDSRANKSEISDSVKDAIALVSVNLPSDMDEPLIRGVGHARAIMQLSIFSQKVEHSELVALAKNLKSRLLSIEDVSDVTIFGDSELFYEILIDEKKVAAYNLSLSEVLKLINELSNIYPLGEIDNRQEKFYLSTNNGKKLASELENTILNIDDMQIMLGDIASVRKRYEDSSTLASMNAKNSITLAISQNPKGDAIEIAQNIKDLLATLDSDSISYTIRMDNSNIIKNSLNIIISNILLGVILISLLSMILINIRIAFIIALGIPTSFVMGAIYFYISGYSINVNSLIGVLIAIGIIVDDAIVVSENIQQYIEKGYSAKEAAYLGTKEMLKPVTIASLTTLFSFIPLLMLSGTLGEIVRLIPIAFSALIIASLIDSFIFLPIHASHALSPNSKTLSWGGANILYIKSLSYLMRHQKLFLSLFLILVPLLIFAAIKESKFHIFEHFDSNNINITFKADPTLSVEESLQIIQTIERDLLKDKEQFFIKYVSSTAGYRRSATGKAEISPNVGYISLELENRAPENIFERYITPILSPYENLQNRVRPLSSKELAANLRRWIQAKEYKKSLPLKSIVVLEEGMKHTPADIMIGVVSDDYREAIRAIEEIEQHFSRLDGIKYYANNIKLGPKEIKLSINSYGESLGITEEYIANYIAKLYLSSKVGTIFDNRELIEVRVKSINAEDRVEEFKNLSVLLKNSKLVRLKDICDFETIDTLERVIKDNGATTFYFYANIEPSKTTSSEILMQMQEKFAKLNAEGIKLIFRGEVEQTKSLETEMLLASLLALMLIFISILYLFNSIRETLIVISVIPLSLLGVYAGHSIMQIDISLPSLIGALGLAGVIVNDGIIMMATLNKSRTKEQILPLATTRLRPIVLTSITTLIGLSSLIFFASGQATTFQPLAVSIGFGLFWGTLLNLFYLPLLYNFLKRRL